MTNKRLLAELERAQLRATRERARWLVLLAEAERREVTLRQLGLPTAGWLTDRNSHWARSAREEVRLAVQLDAEPRVAEALAGGGLSLEQATVIVHGLDRLPRELDSSQREAAAQLVELGREFGPYGLSRLVNRVVEVVAPQVAEDADRRAVERVEAEQDRDRYLSWSRDADGAVVFRGKLGKVAGQQLVRVLGSLALRRLLPRAGADRPRILVAVDLEVLNGRLGTATLLNTADQIGAGEARRLACDAVHHILAWVLGGRTELGNGVLLCAFHHHLVEPNPNGPPDQQWQIRLNSLGNPEFGAPVGLGAPPGGRRWRLHHRYA